jgi:RHS repeat-associated protein
MGMAPVRPGSQSRSDLIGKIGPRAGAGANRIFSADDPFAALSLNKGYGSIAADFSDSDGTLVRGGPRAPAEEYGDAPSANDIGGESLAEHPVSAEPSAPHRVKSRDVAGNLAVFGSFSFTNSPQDTTPPTNTFTFPAAGATNVNFNTWVGAGFNELLDVATVNGSTVELRDSSNALVSGTVSYITPTGTARLQPTAPLAAGTTYTARVRGGSADPRVKDLAGNALAADVTWTFTTATDTTPPTVVSSNPVAGATNVNTNTNITVTFSEAMLAISVNGSTVELRNPSNTLMSASVSYNAASSTATLDPTASLAPGTTYTARVRGGNTSPRVTDVAGNALAADVTWTFTTAPPPDTTPPTVTSVSPVSGATGVSTGANVTVTFSEAMGAATVNGSTVDLRDPTNALVLATVSYNAVSLTATLDPTAPLAPGVTYTARVRGGGTDPRVKDVAGNALTADVTWSFTTTLSGAIPLDGLANLSYNASNNRVNTLGFEYDHVGNQTRAVIANNGTQQQYRYDCANRLVQVSDASGNVLATYAYGTGNQRLMSVEGGVTKYFAWDAGKIIAEYEAWGANGLIWKTSYVYLGGQLLATTSGADGTETRFHHPDRLGTRLTTDAVGTVVSEQFPLPFGNMQPFTSVYGGENPYQHPTLGNPSKKRFTSYDRSDATGLDYAVNRFYSPQQGRFTQVDPIGMGAAELANPQSLNLYSYVENDPINSTDPLGLDGIVNSIISWSGPFPTGGGGGGGGGGLRLGPFSIGFSFQWGGWYFSQALNRYQWFKGTEKPKPDEDWVEVNTGKIYDSIYGEVILLAGGWWDYTRNLFLKGRNSVLRDNELSPFFLGLIGAYLIPFAGAKAAGGTLAGFVRAMLISELTGQAIDGTIDDSTSQYVAAGVVISPIAEDWAQKGAHVRASNGVELAVRPGMNGEIVLKPVFSSTPKDAANAAIREVREKITMDPVFRAKLARDVGRGVEYLRTGSRMARSRSGELRFLLKALLKLK